MKVIDVEEDTKYITLAEARREVENTLNNSTKNALYVVKYDGEIISLSGRYYKFAYKTIGNVKTALTNKFGKDLAKALIEGDVIEVVKVYI